MKCGKCNTEFALSRYCPNCGADMNDIENVCTNSIPVREYPMKWYKFLKVILWIGIILNFSQGILSISGHLYEGMTDAVYAAVPGLRTLNIFSGLALIGYSVIGFMAWYGLKNYKENGPKFLISLYVIDIAVSVIYMMAFSSIISAADVGVIYGEAYQVGENMYTPYIDLQASGNTLSSFPSIIYSVAMAIYNYKYFKEREDLFIK